MFIYSDDDYAAVGRWRRDDSTHVQCVRLRQRLSVPPTASLTPSPPVSSSSSSSSSSPSAAAAAAAAGTVRSDDVR